MLMSRALALFIALALLLAGCADDGAEDEVVVDETNELEETEAPAPSPDTTTPEETPAGAQSPEAIQLTQSCANEQDGYALDYPEGWHVNDAGDPTEACRVFDPQPFELEAGTEIPAGLAVVADVEPVPMERIAQGDRGVEVLTREETTVAGNEALILEMRATDEAPLQEPGTRTYRYLVRLGPERTFVLRTSDVGELPYERKIVVLEAMIETVELS
jgi:hypothetical protein